MFKDILDSSQLASFKPYKGQRSNLRRFKMAINKISFKPYKGQRSNSNQTAIFRTFSLI